MTDKKGGGYSTTERNVPSVRPIPNNRLNLPSLDKECPMTLEAMKEIEKHLVGQGLLDESLAEFLIKTTARLLAADPNVVAVSNSSVVIVGDLHGQFYDLINIMRNVCSSWHPSKCTYVFLGDYVDRGSFSTELVLYVCCLKLLYPRNVVLLRGNHESEKLNKNFNFPHEFASKYSDKLYSLTHQMFNRMPIAAIVTTASRRYFCAHGGISRKAKDIADLNDINRFTDVVQNGVMTDLLWSDPTTTYETSKNTTSYEPNKARGCAHRYSHAAVKKFLKRNNLTCVIRGHEVMDAGYRLYKQPGESFPTLITVFSAPNYVDSYGNKGAVLVIEEDEINVQTFREVPHPYLLPDQLNAFTWSMPYVAKSVHDMLMMVLNVCTSEEMSEEDSKTMTPERRAIVKGKIKAVARMGNYYNILQRESDAIMKLKVLSPTGKLSAGLLSEGQEGLMAALARNDHLPFDDVKKLDAENEKLPRAATIDDMTDDYNEEDDPEDCTAPSNDDVTML